MQFSNRLHALSLFPLWYLALTTHMHDPARSMKKKDHTHLCPNISVDLVSASLKTEGEQQITMVVLQFPPRESWRIRVILLSRYGTCVFCVGREKYRLLQPIQRKNTEASKLVMGTLGLETHGKEESDAWPLGLAKVQNAHPGSRVIGKGHHLSHISKD